MYPRASHHLWCFVILLASLPPARVARAAPSVPPDFVVENAVPGTSFSTPTGIAFLPDGRLLVAEKRGTVWIVKDGTRLTTPFWTHDAWVLDSGDRGLLDVAVDPGFATNHYVYFLYTADPDSNGVDDDDDAFGRLERYRVGTADTNVVDMSTRSVLFGRTWSEGPPSGSITHTSGSLRWGNDGSLMVSVGEGAQFSAPDAGGRDAGLFEPGRNDPSEDIGAFRAQYLGSLAGKILRLDPQSGLGYASNPFYDGDPASVRSRVYAYGLRNPFRFTVRPGTGSPDPSVGNPGALYIGDVGWETWEEVDVCAQGGKNFGWPCYEGSHPNPDYQNASPAHNGCGSVGTASNPSPFTDPLMDWHHSNTTGGNPAGYRGICSIGGTFYTATGYPASYQGAYFYADYGQDWIRYATVTDDNAVTQTQSFGDNMDGPVDLVPEPGTGHLVYVSINTGEVRRIRYGGGAPGNGAPTAVAAATPDVGVTPLNVNFSSTGSSDPDGDPLSFRWVFGDGFGSTAAHPSHTFTLPGRYDVVLTVDDGRGGAGADTVTVIAAQSAGFPTTAVLDDFDRPDGPLGDPWVDPVFGLGALSIDAGALAQTCCAYQAPAWSGQSFGPDQEAFVTIARMTSDAPEQDLMLKLQQPRYDAAHLEVRYDDQARRVSVATYAPDSGWMSRGDPIPVTFLAGDQLGARAYSTGDVDIFRNGVLLGTVGIGGWPHAAAGGWIGLTLDGAYASRLDDFGGGDMVISSNTPPLAAIVTPGDSSFYAAGDSIRMQASATDAQQPPATLTYDWVVDLNHNTHVHPRTFVASGSYAALMGFAHDDDSRISLTVKLAVADSGGLADTARVSIFPEVDLEPSAVTVMPDSPATATPTAFRFRILNRGRMPSGPMRWQLTANQVSLAFGDTVVAGLDSVSIMRTMTPQLAPGTYALRLTADTLGAVVETLETNNSRTRSMTVVDGGSVDVPENPPSVLALSMAGPNPDRNDLRLALELPVPSRVGFAVHDVQGREVWRTESRQFAAGRWSLRWPGTMKGGGQAPAGLYFARVQVADRTLVHRLALLR